MALNPFDAGLGAPRSRSEIEPAALLRTPRPFPLVRLQTTASVLVTAREDADFLLTALWVANVDGSNRTWTLYLVPDGGSPGVTNLIAGAVPIVANTSTMIDLNQGFLVQPEYSLQALCSSNDTVNMVGWGYDVQGDIKI